MANIEVVAMVMRGLYYIYDFCCTKYFETIVKLIAFAEFSAK